MTIEADGLPVRLIGAGTLSQRIRSTPPGFNELAVREGWLDKHWRFAEARKIQSLVLTQSPFDRRHGMASLLMDTVGASPFEPPLRVRYLPEAEARALRDQLAAAMEAAATPARTPA